MRERKINNQEIDAIGKQLFAASRLTEAEIDRIASVPDLFDGVRSRIARQEPTAVRRSPELQSIPRLAVGASFALVLVLLGFAIYLQQNQPAHVITNVPVEKPGEARALTPQVRIVKGFTQARATFLDEANTPDTPRYDQAIQRETRRPQPRAERASFVEPQENHFVAVTYVGEGAESTRGGRVVRVDVPRSTLFAMGFNVSLENDSPTVKADLLIGPDGVTRAVRLVE
jgi:hypothetical protein